MHLTRDMHTYPYNARFTKLLSRASRLLYGRGTRG
jgi:hypothetical protein